MTAIAHVISNVCPHCHYEYAHLQRAPDVCTNCFKVINDNPVSDIFACPDFLSFQLEVLKVQAKEFATGVSQGEPGQKALSSEDVQEKIFNSKINNELYCFVTTVSYETVLSAIRDAEIMMKHVDHNRNLTPQELMNICDKVEALGKYAASLKELIKAGKGNLYEYRRQTSQATEVGERARSASSSI
jgi:hypothetical protein